MKKRALLLLALLFIFAVALAACEHIHTFDDSVWMKDDNYHWHKATCEHSDEQGDKAEHDMENVPGDWRRECVVCGYSVKVTPVHEHTYAANWTSNDEYHWQAATCEHATEVKNKAKHIYNFGVCTVCDRFNLASAVNTLNDMSYAVNLAGVEIGDIGLDVDAILIEDGELNFRLEDDNLVGYGSAHVVITNKYVVNGNNVDNQIRASAKLVVQGGVAYVYCEQDATSQSICVRKSAEDLLADSEVNTEQIYAVLNALKQNVDLIETYVTKAIGILRNVQIDDAELKAVVSKIFKEVEDSSADGKKVYVVDYNVLRDINNTLATKTISQYVDGVFGDGFYKTIPQKVKEVFDMRIEEFLEKLEQLGYTVDDLIDTADKLIAENYPNPDINSVDDIIALTPLAKYDMTAKELVKYIGKLKVSYLYEMVRESGDLPLTTTGFINKVKEYCNAYENKTVYECIASSNENLSPKLLKALVGELTDIIESFVTVEVNLDADKNVHQIVLTLGAQSDDNSSANAELTEEQIAAIEMLAPLKGALSNVNGSVKLTKDYKLKGDYDDVVDTVNSALNSVAVPINDDDLQAVARSIVGDGDADIKSVTAKDSVVTIVYNYVQKAYLVNGIYAEYDVTATLTVNFDKAMQAVSGCKDKLTVTLPLNSNLTFTRTIYNNLDSEGYYLDDPVEMSLAEFTNYCDESGSGVSAKEMLEDADGYLSAPTEAVLYYDVSARKFVEPESVEHAWKLVESERVVSTVCGQYSKEVYECAVCHTKTVNYSYVNHTPDDGSRRVEVVDGNCEKGVKVYCTCLRCHNEYINYETPYTQHSTVGRLVTFNDIDCKDHAIKVNVCTVCNKIIDFVYVHGVKVTDPDALDTDVVEMWKCRDDACDLVIKEYVKADYDDYNITVFKVMLGGKELYSAESIRYKETADEHRHDYSICTFNSNGNSCVEEGADVYAVCGICNYHANVGTLYMHDAEASKLDLPADVCDTHYFAAYICNACGLGVGTVIDDKVVRRDDENNAEIYGCDDCGYVIKRILLEADAGDNYDVIRTEVLSGDNELFSCNYYNYENGTSYPPCKDCKNHATRTIQYDEALNSCSSQRHCVETDMCQTCGMNTVFMINGVWNAEYVTSDEYELNKVIRTLTCESCNLTVTYTVISMPKCADHVIVRIEVVEDGNVVYSTNSYYYYETNDTYTSEYVG